MCLRKKSIDKSPEPLSRRATGLSGIHNPNSKRAPAPVPSPTNPNTEQPRDDGSIIRLFSLIDNSITDHVLNYYISPASGTGRFSQFGKNKKELGWVLRAPASRLKEARTQVIVIRAVIGYEIFRAIRDDYFIPPAPRNLLAKKQAPADPKWRLDYFQSLSNNQQYPQYRDKAIEKLTNDIMKMTQPLAVSTDKSQEDARLTSLKIIIESAAEFTFTIGKQKPSFEIIYPQFPTSKTPAAISRSTSRSGSKRAKTENFDVPVLVPELRKYGDERGANYDKYLTLISVQGLPEGF